MERCITHLCTDLVNDATHEQQSDPICNFKGHHDGCIILIGPVEDLLQCRGHDTDDGPVEIVDHCGKEHQCQDPVSVSPDFLLQIVHGNVV